MKQLISVLVLLVLVVIRSFAFADQEAPITLAIQKANCEGGIYSRRSIVESDDATYELSNKACSQIARKMYDNLNCQNPVEIQATVTYNNKDAQRHILNFTASPSLCVPKSKTLENIKDQGAEVNNSAAEFKDMVLMRRAACRFVHGSDGVGRKIKFLFELEVEDNGALWGVRSHQNYGSSSNESFKYEVSPEACLRTLDILVANQPILKPTFLNVIGVNFGLMRSPVVTDVREQ